VITKHQVRRTRSTAGSCINGPAPKSTCAASAGAKYSGTVASGARVAPIAITMSVHGGITAAVAVFAAECRVDRHGVDALFDPALHRGPIRLDRGDRRAGPLGRAHRGGEL